MGDRLGIPGAVNFSFSSPTRRISPLPVIKHKSRLTRLSHTSPTKASQPALGTEHGGVRAYVLSESIDFGIFHQNSTVDI